jgi:hypothetical protein
MAASSAAPVGVVVWLSAEHNFIHTPQKVDNRKAFICAIL